MKTRLYLILAALLVCNLYYSQSFKKLYKESFKYLEVNDYENALPLLMKMYDLMVDNIDDLAKIITLEAGKPFAESKGEVLYAASNFKFFAIYIFLAKCNCTSINI